MCSHDLLWATEGLIVRLRCGLLGQKEISASHLDPEGRGMQAGRRSLVGRRSWRHIGAESLRGRKAAPGAARRAAARAWKPGLKRAIGPVVYWINNSRPGTGAPVRRRSRRTPRL